MVMDFIGKYLIAILCTALVALMIAFGFQTLKVNRLEAKTERQAVELGVVAAMSQNQEIKIVESKLVEERIKVLTQDKIKYVTEYVYDENKSECDNTIDRMRTVL